MKNIIECRRNLDFNNLTSDSFAYMIKGDLQRAKKDYESECGRDFENYAKIEIDYDYSPQSMARTIHFDNLIDEAKNAFESIKKSKNFIYAEGWNIEFETNDRTNKILYGIKIAIVFNESYEKEIKENKVNKTKEIRNFNDSLSYKGD